ncbi:hypothetical protein ATE92_0099 [Ulvibacter sp. MAR_2010_11]|uniref:hypothetical protein n=1 Tax=Ulvibacter sp. MAR_2010_11 TaxID=1250229 RepID=UPI000C2C3355|nr:hypothetical protein [Ulvibacter sp. MAR_2010_11]PKA81976.1 hypothetical protein ATE92_0099 [Ulvibacter sp. MAR_2010_11]
MKNFKNYIFEYLLIFITIILTISGFWNIFFGTDAKPKPYQIFHLIVNFSWLFLMLYQLTLIGNKQSQKHKRVGLSILFFGPLFFAQAVLLAIHSAHKGFVSGEGDFMIVQNVLGSIELGLIILLAFILKKRRKIHAAFLISTVVLMLGISIFFLLLAVAPELIGYGMYITFFVGLLFFLKDRRDGWPILASSSVFIINDYITTLLIKLEFIKPLTDFVGSLNQAIAFFVSFIVLLFLLISTGITNKRRAGTLRKNYR